MDQREIRLRCLQLAASVAPKGSGSFTLKLTALDLERFVTTEGSADEVEKAMCDARLQAEKRSLDARREMEAMLNGDAHGKPARRFGDLY